MLKNEKRQFLPYSPALKILARELRKNSTLSEVLLWKQLQREQMLSYEFHRQVPISNFIVDFYCHELRLAIEIDGESHQDKVLKDTIRQLQLEKLGVSFLRFTDLEPKTDIQNVLKAIQNWIEEKTSPSPPSKGE